MVPCDHTQTSETPVNLTYSILYVQHLHTYTCNISHAWRVFLSSPTFPASIHQQDGDRQACSSGSLSEKQRSGGAGVARGTAQHSGGLNLGGARPVSVPRWICGWAERAGWTARTTRLQTRVQLSPPPLAVLAGCRAGNERPQVAALAVFLPGRGSPASRARVQV